MAPGTAPSSISSPTSDLCVHPAVDFTEESRNGPFDRELIADSANSGTGEATAKVTVGRKLSQRIRDGLRISFGNDHPSVAFEQLRNATRIRSDHGQPGCHRLNQEYRNSFPLFPDMDAGEQCHVPPMICELHQELPVVYESQELHAIQHVKCDGMLLQRYLQRSVPDTVERHVHAGRLEPGNGLQRVAVSFYFDEASRQQNSKRDS